MSTTTAASTTPSSSYYTPARPAPRPASPLFSSPRQKKTMSITQTYYLAHKARAKLSSEAARPDHDLRLLVGHANLLDSLMLELAEAEREQESWFNQSVRGATKSSHQEKRQQPIQWAETVVEEPEEDWEAEEDASSSDSGSDDSCSESDSDSSEDDYDEEGDVEMADAISFRRVASHSGSYAYGNKAQHLDSIGFDRTQANEEAVEFEDDYEEEDYAQLTLTRSPSHSHSPPPELAEDDDSSEDEAMPPSPPNPPMHEFTDKEREAIVTTGYYGSNPSESDRSSFYDQGFYIPPRSPARLASAISVY